MKKNLVNAAVVVALAGCASTPEGAPAGAAAPVADAAPAAEALVENQFYTTRQASRGNGLFRDNCVSCHATSEFTGSSFERRWRGRAVGDIYEFILYSMPDDNPGGLPEQTYADILAFVLELNDFPAGESELPTSMDTLMQMQMLWADPAGGGDQ
jgi:hypothetical protein